LSIRQEKKIQLFAFNIPQNKQKRLKNESYAVKYAVKPVFRLFNFASFFNDGGKVYRS